MDDVKELAQPYKLADDDLIIELEDDPRSKYCLGRSLLQKAPQILTAGFGAHVDHKRVHTIKLTNVTASTCSAFLFWLVNDGFPSEWWHSENQRNPQMPLMALWCFANQHGIQQLERDSIWSFLQSFPAYCLGPKEVRFAIEHAPRQSMLVRVVIHAIHHRFMKGRTYANGQYNEFSAIPSFLQLLAEHMHDQVGDIRKIYWNVFLDDFSYDSGGESEEQMNDEEDYDYELEDDYDLESEDESEEDSELED